ncbi:MAG: hypothetical protein NTZ98_02570 [Acidobacteria bacterium]|jgi:hypothetical protein|nr:hypothetical protein [Acidobacteriota bacterium]
MGYASTTHGLPRPRFQPGRQVQFRLANQVVRGTVTEYRGPLAVGGRHLYRVEVPFSGKYVQVYEIPEDELKPA